MYQHKRHFKILLLLLSIIFTTQSFAKSNDDNWFRQTAISPDGKTILFTAKGDIYKVSSAGGDAIALISDSAWDGYPIWSHNGKYIAFASDRNSNLDVYVVKASGGNAKRLTFNSSNDIPTDFSKNNKQVMFSSARMAPATSSAFPSSRMPQLYAIDIKGGTPNLMLGTPALESKLSPNGKTLVYMDNKGYENRFRKHDLSSFARDIWSYDLKSKKHNQLTHFKGGDSSPVWSHKGKSIYYLSEQDSGTYNVWKMDKQGKQSKQLTDHDTHPVRNLSISDNGLLAYSYHGDIFTLTKDKTTKKLKIHLASSTNTTNTEKVVNVANKASEFSVSPNGKEVAFIARGEVFVTAVDYGTTVRITNTPEQERSVSWFPDGRSIVYAAERDDIWGLYQTQLGDKEEPYFFAATKFEEKTLLKSKSEAFQPKVSPDGKQIAYIKQRDEISVFDLASKKSHTVFSSNLNYSYADGDLSFDWSPDSKWITASYIPYGMYAFTNIGIAPADGSKPPKDISFSGYGDVIPRWINKDTILFASSRYGRRNHGSWGSDWDVMGLFLTQKGYDDYQLNKEERELIAEALKKETDASKDDDKDENKADKKKAKKDKDKAVEPIKIDWHGIEDRTVRLTIHSSDLAGMELTSNGEKLYYLAKFEKGYDLWLHDFKEKSTKLALKLNAKKAQFALTKKGEFAIIWADGKLLKVKLDKSHKKTNIQYQSNLNINAQQERQYLFDHIWRQTKDKFYNTNMHGVNWDKMYKEYSPKVTTINNNRDFATLASELLGELNASHTGGYYFTKHPNYTKTASLGVIYGEKASKEGVVITDILFNSPFNKTTSIVKKGAIITKIDNKPVNASHNIYAQLNGKQGQRTRITIKDHNKTFDVVLRPISLSDENKGLYKRWVNSRRALVDKLSAGKLGYVHVPQMDDKAFRSIFSDIFGRGFNKKALVVDTRFNRGGWLTDDLVTLLSGKQYTWEYGRGNKYKGDSMKRWTKPSIVVMNEGNYSDGHCFPMAYKANSIGKTVGMPVPGTCTAVWWETLQSGDLVFGIPQLGVADMNGKFLEHQQLLPDFLINNTPETLSKGQDKQLEKAVEELSKSL